MWVKTSTGWLNLAHAWSVFESDNGHVSVTWSTATGKESEDFTGRDAAAIIAALEQTQQGDDDSVSGIINQAFKRNLRENLSKPPKRR